MLPLCQCGCGQTVTLVTQTNSREGVTKGEPRRFVRGHYLRMKCQRGEWDLKTFEPREQRFWKYVHKTDGCWIWTGFRDEDGYGRFDSSIAHRVSWELRNGAIPSGMSVCHRCDNPNCVNPEHLFLGTPLDNSRDMVAKGRSARGTKQHSSKLTPQIVIEIRRLYAPGIFGKKDVATKLGVTLSSVHDVLRGRSWRWL